MLSAFRSYGQSRYLSCGSTAMARNYQVSTNHLPQEYCNLLIGDQAAVAALNSLQSNFAIVDAIRKSGGGMNQQAIPEMIEWCKKIGYQVCIILCFN